MAKKRTQRPIARLSVKNAHLIGAGAKFTPVYTNEGKINFRASVIKQSNSRDVPKLPKSNRGKTQSNFRMTVQFKAQQHTMAPQQKPLKAKLDHVRLKGLKRMQQNIIKNAPSTKIKMKSRTPAKKGPAKGR